MTVIGKASIHIRASDKYFEKDIQSAVRKIKNVNIDLKADVNMTKVTKKIRDLRQRLKNNDLMMNADIITTSAEKRMDELYERFDGKTLSMNFDADTKAIDEAAQKLFEMEENYDGKTISVSVDSDVSSLTNKLEAARVRYGTLASVVKASADIVSAEAKLAFLTRKRKADIFIGLDPKMAGAVKGFVNILTGTLPFEKIKMSIAGAIENFEHLAVTGTSMVSILGILSAAALSAGGDLLSLGSDILEVVGIAAAMPAGIASMAVGITALTMAWSGFGDSLDEDPKKAAEALAKLPKEAQAASKGIKGIGGAIAGATQVAYWKRMQTALQDTIQKIEGPLTRGMRGAGTAMADQTRSMLTSIRNFDGIDGVFDNINEGFRNSAKGTESFTDALLVLINDGAKRLPQFGTWVTKLGTQFEGFIRKASENGDILRWIDQAVDRIKQLGSIAKSSYQILGSLTNAAKLAGAAGLEDFAEGMKSINNTMASADFQTKMVTIFKASYEAMASVRRGLGEIGELISSGIPGISTFLVLAGRIAEYTFENFAALFDGTGLGSGTHEALLGLNDALIILKPGFQDIGRMVGDLGEIVGELLRNMAPGINQLAETLRLVVGNMKDGIIAAMPAFNEFIQALLGLVSGPIAGLAGALGGLLSAFAALPGPIQTAMLALAGILAVKKHYTAAFGSISSVMRKLPGEAAGVAVAANSAFTGRMNGILSVRDSISKIGTAWGTTRVAFGIAGSTTGIKTIGTAAGTAAKAIGTTAGQGLRAAAGGAMSMLGGPWGVALAGAGVAVGLFADHQAKAKARIEEFSATLEKQSGKITQATEQSFGSKILDGPTGAWDNFVIGFLENSKTMEETFSILGLKMSEFTDKALDPQHGEAYRASWEEIESQLKRTGTVTEEAAGKVGLNTAAFRDLGINGATTIERLNDRINDNVGALTKAQERTKQLAEIYSTTSINGEQLAKNTDILASSTTSASEKLSAFKQNMTLTGSETMSATGGIKEYFQTLDNSTQSFKELGLGSASAVKGLYDVKKGFDFSKDASRDLHTILGTTADSIHKVSIEAYDSAIKGGESVEQATMTAIDSSDEMVASLRRTLTGLGFSRKEVDGLVDSFGLLPTDIATAITVDGSAAKREVIETALITKAFVDGDYSAILRVTSGDAKKEMGEVLGLGAKYSNEEFTAALSATADKANISIDELMLKLSTAESEEHRVQILAELNDSATPGLATLQNKMNAALKGVKIPVKVKDEATAPVRGINAALASVKGKSTSVKVTSNAVKAAGDSVAALEKIKAKNPKISAEIDPLIKQAKAAQAHLKGVKDKAVAVTVKDLASGPSKKAKDALASVKGKNVSVEAKSNALKIAKDSVAALQTIKNKRPEISAEIAPLLAAAKKARDQIASVKSKSVTLTGIDHVSSVINSINAKKLINKSNTITTVYKTSGAKYAMANGGVINGRGVQSFASGGFSKIDRSIQRAAGQREQHVAQIAKGGFPYRVWAEPETGGEAYLPLHKNKRARSMKILEQVAAHFGVGLTEQFANGGFSQMAGKKNSGGSMSFATGGSTTKLAAARKAAAAKSKEASTSARNEMSAAMTQLLNSLQNIFGSPSSPLIAGLNETRKGLNEVARQYGKSSAINSKRAKSVSKRMSTQDNLSKGVWSSKRSDYLDSEILANRVQKARATKTKKDDILKGVTLADYERALTLTQTAVQTQQSKLDTMISQRDSAMSSLSSSIKGEFNIGSLVGQADSFGYRAPVTAAGINSYATALASKIKGFAGKLKALRGAGYNAALVNEVASLGSTEGSIIADALMKDTSMQKTINAAYTGITRSGGYADVIGKQSADAMYGEGIKVQQGIVKGLTDDVSAIKLAGKLLGDTLIAAYRKALGINSPSKVFQKATMSVPEGVILALDLSQKKVDDRVASLVTTKPLDLSVKRTTVAAGAGAGTQGDILGTDGGGFGNIIVHAAPGMSEEAIGQSAARELKYRWDFR